MNKRWYEFECLSLPEQTMPEPKWHRSSFMRRTELKLATPPGDHASARRLLQQIAARFVEGTRFRLVLTIEETFDDMEIVSPGKAAA